MFLISNFLDRVMMVKKEPKKIASVFSPDNLRVGIILAREVRNGLKVSVRFCFSGKTGQKIIFFGWSDDKRVETFVKERFPGSKITPNHPMDALLDRLENLMYGAQ